MLLYLLSKAVSCMLLCKGNGRSPARYVYLDLLKVHADDKRMQASAGRQGCLHAGGTDPYGVDPSFSTQSGLYRPDSFQRRWQFFNSSQHSPELSASRAPYAFFPRISHGYSHGFPVFFPVCIQSVSDAQSTSCLSAWDLIGFICPREQTLPIACRFKPQQKQ
jgi:hypothetical protein